MHKLLVFDLDGTLAPIGKGALPETVDKLKALEARGYRIAVCSGKPTYYLCGILRQWELKEPVMIGENGAVFQFGVDLPPKRFEIFPYGEKAKEQMELLRKRIFCGNVGALWYQPNEVALTPFPYERDSFERIQAILDAHPEDLTELAVYPQVDCFDILPRSISKAEGVAYLASLLGLTQRDVLAVGDGVNDIPMLTYADLSIGIGKAVGEVATICFDTIGDALDYILTKD